MKISDSTVALSSAYQLRESYTRKESLRVWVGDQRPDFSQDASAGGLFAPTPQPQKPPRLMYEVPPPPKCGCNGAGVKKSAAAEAADEDKDLDATTLLIKKLIEKLFGVKIHMSSLPQQSDTPSPPLNYAPQASAAPQRQGWGVEYESHAVREESEQMQFKAAGVVHTADGKEIKFAMSVDLTRYSRQEENFQLKAGDALIDPLVLNFDGPATQLRSGSFSFDLNNDGQNEKLPGLGSGTGFLALDRNQDGKINNGSELFGPTTGQGFAELNSLDSDGNGWIDENDASYGRLSVWQPTEDGGGKLTSLAEKNVGAIYLQSVSTPFTYKNEAQETQAKTSASSVFLQEDGRVGTVQQLDFVA